MRGRYGADGLFYFEIAVYLIFCIITAPFGTGYVRYILNAAALLIAFHALYRCLSRNIVKRQAENAKFLAVKRKVTMFFKRQINRIKYRKIKVYKKCPSCGVFLCLPKKKGVHTVKCPSCRHRFDVKIK